MVSNHGDNRRKEVAADKGFFRGFFGKKREKRDAKRNDEKMTSLPDVVALAKQSENSVDVSRQRQKRGANDVIGFTSPIDTFNGDVSRNVSESVFQEENDYKSKKKKEKRLSENSAVDSRLSFQNNDNVVPNSVCTFATCELSSFISQSI